MDPREEALWKKYAAKGVTPETHTLDMANGRFVPRTDVANDGNAPQAESAWGSFARAAAGGVGPAIGAGLGGAAGTVAGAAVAPSLGPAAPAMPLALGLAGGVGGGALGEMAQHKIAETVAPEITKEWNAQEELNRAEHPYASMAGTLLPMLLSNQMSAFKNLKALGTVARSPISRNPAAMRTLRGAAVNAGIGAGLESVQEAMPGADVDPGKIALAAAGGAAMGDFRKPFKKFGGMFGNEGARVAAFGHGPGDDVTTVEAARGANIGKNWNEAVQAAAKAAGVKEAVPAADVPVPEAADTIATQLTALADPSTTRKAVLVTSGTKSPPTPKGMRSVQTKHGRVIYNPEKATLQEIAAADAAEQFPGDLLGMSQQAKPAGGDKTVEAVTPDGTEASSEVVDGNNPAAVKAAADAAVAANGDGVTVKVTDPAEVVAKRANATSRRADVEAGLTADNTQPVPEPEVGQYPEEGMGTGEIPTPEELARREAVRAEIASRNEQKAKIAKWKAFLEGEGYDTAGMTDEQLAAEQVPGEESRRWQGKQEDKPPAMQPAVKQGWHDFWKRTALGRYLASSVNPGKVTMPNGKAARGVTDLSDRSITIDPAIATLDTHPHEVFHLLLNDILAHGTAGEKAYIKRAMEAFGGEEALTQAVGEHFVKRLDPKNDGMVRDVLDFVRYKLGRSNDRALLARLGSNILGRGRGGADMPGVAKATGVRHQGSTDQPDDRTFVTDFEKELNNNPTRPFKIQIAKDGRMSANDVRSALAKAHPVEQELLKSAGIGAFLDKVVRPTPNELASWIKENGPRVEVHAYGQQRKVSKERAELDRLTHEWWDNLSDTDKYQVQRYKLGERTSLPSPLREQADKYFMLMRKVREEPSDTSPRATHYYNQLSPKDTKKFPVQRVDVVLPRKLMPDSAEAYATKPYNTVNGKDYELALWEQDNTHENLPNTIGWAAIQYETLPSGEKVAHVYEAQGRWPQQRRKLEKEWLDRVEPAEDGMFKIRPAANSPERQNNLRFKTKAEVLEYFTKRGSNTPEHPLLKDYNRLILKAAIDEARKNGATKIAISDAETAMMSEGHDANAQYGSDYVLSKNGKPDIHIKHDGSATVTQRINNLISTEGYKATRLKNEIAQEGGMRFNYDPDYTDPRTGKRIGGNLHNIAEELTGSKGEPVNFGEHKNAVKSKSERVAGTNTEDADSMIDTSQWITRTVPRDNLIFRNPDGTPKTDVTARMYDISAPSQRRAAGEPYGLVNKRYQGGEGEGSTSDEPGLKSRTRVFTAPVEVLRGAKDVRYRDVGNAILTAHHNAQELTAEFVNPVHDVVKGLDAEQKAAVRGALIDAFNEREARYTGNAKLDRAIDTIRSTYAEIRERANEAGMKVTDRHGVERSGRIDPYGMPHILDKDVQHVLKNEVGSDKWNALVEEFKAYNRDRLSAAHKKLSPADIEDILDAKIKYMSGGVQDLPGGVRSKQADRAMRLAQLTKLPESFIEKDIDKLWTTYARSAAHDLAQWINLERDPRIRALLGFNRHSADDLNIPPIAGHQVVKAAMEGFNKPFGTDDKINKLADTLSSATSAAIVANPKTRLLDLASVPFRSLTYTSPWHAPEIVVRSFANAGDAWRASKATGFNKPGSQHVDNVIGAVNNTTKWVKKALQWYSKGTASEGIEAVSRAATQAMGRATIDTLAAPYARGNKEALRIINGLGTDASELMSTSAGRDKLASRLGGYTQGFYDARNEPQWLTGGTGKAIFRLSRWSVEQMNNFRKFQIEPLLKDGNPGPAISYLLAMAAGGAVLNEAKDKLAGHKSYTATMKELQAAGDTPAARMALAQKLSGMAQIVGAFGYANDLAYMALSGITGQPMNEWNVPLAKLLSDGFRHTTAAAGAIARGADTGQVLRALIENVAKQNIGMVRFIANQAESEEERTSRNNKRDYSVYRTLHGQPAKPFAPIVGYDKLDEKEFDKEWDAGKAMNRLEGILAQTPPERMVEKLRSLRATAPIGEGPRTKDTDKLVPYINWIRETQGDDAANELYRRLVEKETINEFKRGLVPSVR